MLVVVLRDVGGNTQGCWVFSSEETRKQQELGSWVPSGGTQGCWHWYLGMLVVIPRDAGYFPARKHQVGHAAECLSFPFHQP